MTTASVTPRVKYNGSGSTGPFSIPFRWDASGELIVTKTDDEGVETTLTVTTHYTLTGAGTDTGELTLLTTLAVGETLTIERNTAQTQTVDLEVSYVNPEHLEGALDKLTRAVQDLFYQAGRSLRLYKDDTSGSGVYNAGGQKIGNVSEGVDDNDVAIMAQLNEIAGSADEAAASAAAAAASAAAAALTAQNLEDIILGGVLSFEGRTGSVSAQAGDYTASEITNVASGNLAATNVQSALNELQTDIDGRQQLDAELTALAGLVSAADRLPYFTGSGTASLATFTAAARNLLDDADATTMRATLGLVIGTNVQAYNANLADYASDATAFIQTLIDDVDAATARATLELGSAAIADESAFQDADATLDALAAYNTNGFIAQTAADTFVGRSIAEGDGIAVTNGDGVSGNPTIAVDIDGLPARTAFESGDKLMIFEAGLGLRKIDYDDLPVGGGGSGSGGGASDAYKNITDGTNTAVAVGIDTFKVRAGTGLSVTVGNDDVTHGDNILYELDATLSALSQIATAADKLPYLTGTDTWSTTDLTSFARGLLDDGDAAAMQTTLDLVPGVDVQAYDVELAALAGLTSAADKVPYFTGSGTADVADLTSVARTLIAQTTQALMRTSGLGMSANGSSLVSAADYAAMRALLDLEIGTDVQAYDAELAALAGLTSAADRLPYFTGSGTATLATFTSAARDLLDDADAAAMRTTLGLVIGTDVQAQDAFLQDIADLTDPGADRVLFWDDSAGELKWLTLGTGLTITDTTISVSASGTPAGSVIPYAGTTEPSGWLFCYGQAVSRATYADLFTAIGTTYGAGDGSTTFNLPDVRGRVVAGKDDMGTTSANRLTNQSGGLNGDTLGATGGSETHTLSSGELAVHAHTVSVATTDSAGNTIADGATLFNTSISTGNAGSGSAHNNVQPTIIFNYIIKT